MKISLLTEIITFLTIIVILPYKWGNSVTFGCIQSVDRSCTHISTLEVPNSLVISMGSRPVCVEDYKKKTQVGSNILRHEHFASEVL